MRKYNFSKTEKQWQNLWEKLMIFEPSLKNARKPFYNLMMFPYPSAQGLHVGNMYAFTGSDIYGRFKKMQGFDVFEPIGLDGFGIHSENYALKVGKHPMEMAKITQKNFYRQLKQTGNAYAWKHKLETYDSNYYKWTQWLFLKLFKAGLAYQKEAPANFCPSCKTVLADEQVIQGKCERCSSEVEIKFLKQWFFKITQYAPRLLINLEKLDWSLKVKIAQKNWIGKSEGAEINFRLFLPQVKRFVILHGKGASPKDNFHPWLKSELKKAGFDVEVPKLPNSFEPNDVKQTEYVLKNCNLDENTIVLGHSFGGIVALRLLEKGIKLKGLILVATPRTDKFLDHKKRPFVSTALKKGFNFKIIKENCPNILLLYDLKDDVVPLSDGESFAKELDAQLIKAIGQKPHFRFKKEPEVLNICLPSIKIFTTRIDTIFGATFLVLSPFYELIRKNRLAILPEAKEYIKEAFKKTKKEIKDEKTGVFSGLYAINPATNKKIPIWISDYVLASYGTGAIMAVPAHDQRDFEFAKKYNLPIVQVIQVPDLNDEKNILEKAYEGEGILINSAQFNGLKSQDAKEKILNWLKEKGVAQKAVSYHLRDWLISRQRYWGPPIPIIYCDKCGTVPVPEKDLPVKLPYIKNFKPLGTGKSPLANYPKFYKTKCPICKSLARRETDVSDTFLDSAWYFLRYPSANNKNLPWDKKITKKWLPVDMYIGGAEHSVLHLMYARFISMVLYDLGFVDFEEPFKKFRAHGLLISQGAKMSKSKGNVVNPDEYIKKYGADTLRMYLMFLGPFEQGGDFRDEGIVGIWRFLNRVWQLVQEIKIQSQKSKNQNSKLDKLMHQTIKKVTEDIENLQYNTAISQLMIYQNALQENLKILSLKHIKTLLLLLAPFAPHISEELYQVLKVKTQNQKSKQFKSIFEQKWPKYDPKLIKEETFQLVVQINGKTRDVVEARVGISETEAKELALNSSKIKKWLENKKVIKTFYIQNRLINLLTE